MDSTGVRAAIGDGADTMRCAYYSRQGPAADVLQVGQQPRPEPREGEVRVALAWSGVNPSDWKSRLGGAGRQMPAPCVIPHSDGAGVIDAVGPGVSPGRVGERVWIWNGQWKRPFGTAAQWIALLSAQAVALPEGIDEAEGACLGIPAFTAAHAVDLAQPGPGTTMLVTGGAGSVGQYAIQFAKGAGARVIATASTPDKADHARSVGADVVLDHRSDTFAREVRAAADGGVDSIIEVNLTANAARIPDLIKPHGKVVVYGITGTEATLPVLRFMTASIGIQFFTIYEIAAPARQRALAQIQSMLAHRRLRPPPMQRMPLGDIAHAHDRVQAGILGHVLLDVRA